MIEGWLTGLIVASALARLPAAQGIAAMQLINIVVINPVFLGVFLGTAVASAVLAVAALGTWSEPGAIWQLAGGASTSSAPSS